MGLFTFTFEVNLVHLPACTRSFPDSLPSARQISQNGTINGLLALVSHEMQRNMYTSACLSWKDVRCNEAHCPEHEQHRAVSSWIPASILTLFGRGAVACKAFT